MPAFAITCPLGPPSARTMTGLKMNVGLKARLMGRCFKAGCERRRESRYAEMKK